jgi:sugar O-acyltransferase (sialic acid O-acetyltransferase NeuD family)
MRIAIVGAGGHGKVVLDCLEQIHGEALEAGFFDDAFPMMHEVAGVPVRGSIVALLRDGRFEAAFVAIGDNRRRREVTRQLERAGKRLLTLIHPFTAVSPRARLGAGTIAVAGTVVNADASVGDGVILNTQSSVGHDVVVQDFSQIAPGVHLAGGSIVEEGAFLGIGVQVAPEVRIGAWAVVGAGSVVLEDLPAWTFCCGTPARPVRDLERFA